MEVKTGYTKIDNKDMALHCREHFHTSEVTYSWRNVNVYYKPKAIQRRSFNPFRKRRSQQEEKHILKNVNGISQPGELLAIMGSSGAGKTTLMNVLTHRNMERLKVEGIFSVNGKPMDPQLLTKNSAYVQQEDLFIETLTVYEQLVFQALLRMDSHMTYKQRLDRVEELILELGLTKCAFNLIGSGNGKNSISGGERRRLNFGCEVLTNPSLLFCDEPTSGLDSFMAQNVVAVMKNMAEKGKTILSTIHQPSSEVYAMFDRILLMAQGQVAFLGDADAAYEFFSKLSYRCPENYNPADHYIELLSVSSKHEQESFSRIKVIMTSYSSVESASVTQSILENETDNGQPDPFAPEHENTNQRNYKSSWCSQFKTLLWRSWLELTRNSAVILIRPIQLTVLAILLGVLFGNELTNIGMTNVNGLLFLLLINMTFQNASAVVDTYCGSRALLIREHHSGLYRVDVYFLAKNLVESPIYALYASLYSSIIFLLVGLFTNWMPFLFGVGTIILVTQCVISYSYMISCAAKNTSMALALLFPTIVPLMLCGGFFLNRRSIPPALSWAQYISWFNFGYEAVMINQWKDVGNMTCYSNRRCFADGQAILDYYDYGHTNQYYDLLVLLVLCIVYRVLALLFLWVNVRNNNKKQSN